MEDKRSGQPGPTPAERQRNLESAVLAALIESHPQLLTEAQVFDEMTGAGDAPGRAAAIVKALEDLAEVGLLERRGDVLVPTPASLRVAELELGL
jgi:hypothetical protein